MPIGVLGIPFVLILPGLAWSAIFLRKTGVGLLERTAIAIGLSIVIVPLSAFILNVSFGVAINALNTVLLGAALTAIPAAYILVKKPSNDQEPENSQIPLRLGTVHRAEVVKLMGAFDLSGDTVVDVGAYDGYICSNMKGFATRISMDPSLPDSSHASGVQHIRAVGQALPVRSGLAGAVLCLDVLEHVDEEKPFLNEVIRVLADEGRCYLTVPSKDISVFPGVLQGWANRRWDHMLRTGYTVDELTRLIMDSGGTIHRVVELGSPLFRLFYFPLSLLWRLSPHIGKALLVLFEKFDIRFRNIGKYRGYLFVEFGRRSDA